MKKTVLLLLCVLLLLSLYGCDEPIKNIDPSTNDTEIFQPAPTIAPPSNIYVGMTRDDFLELYPNRGNTFELAQGYSWGHDNYLFINDDQGNPVVITVSAYSAGKPYYLTSIVAYDKNAIFVSEETFRGIEKGMTLHEVVSLVGNPFGNPDAGGLTLGWQFGENIRYCVLWTQHPDDPNVLIVKNIYRADNVAGTYESIFD